MNKSIFALLLFLLGMVSITTLVHTPSSEAEELGASYGEDLQDYAEFAYAYMEMASDYADDACEEAELAEAARNNGDYESFQEHLEAAQEASANAQVAADQAAAYAEMARDIANASSSGASTTPDGIEIYPGPWSNAGLGTSYSVDEITTIWEILPHWDAEDLMGIYIDPTWGMENIPSNWDYEQYINPEYWIQDVIVQESYYGTNNEDEYYLEALDYYENILSGVDLLMFTEDASYHDFLVNVYVNTFVETASYQAAVAESYAQGHLSFDAYETNIQGQVTGYEMSIIPDSINTTDLIENDTQLLENQVLQNNVRNIYQFNF